MENNRNVIIESEISFEDNIYLFSLVMAICNVDIKYILWNDDDISPNTKEHVERVFAYELYHQWSKICEKYQLLKSLVINAELQKWVYNNDNREQLYFPDLVLHGGQNDRNNNNMIVEIKRSSKNNSERYDDDIDKLKMFSNKLVTDFNQDVKYEIMGYSHCVFIIEGKGAYNKSDIFIRKFNERYETSAIIVMFYDGEKLKMTKLGYNFNKCQKQTFELETLQHKWSKLMDCKELEEQETERQVH